MKNCISSRRVETDDATDKTDSGAGAPKGHKMPAFFGKAAAPTPMVIWEATQTFKERTRKVFAEMITHGAQPFSIVEDDATRTALTFMLDDDIRPYIDIDTAFVSRRTITRDVEALLAKARLARDAAAADFQHCVADSPCSATSTSTLAA